MLPPKFSYTRSYVNGYRILGVIGVYYKILYLEYLGVPGKCYECKCKR